MDILFKKISSLVSSQFPSFYASEGPLFIEFVRVYYEWLENVTKSRQTKWINENLSYVTIQSGNTTILGTNTVFTNNFTNGCSIAISRDNTDKKYEVFTVNSVSNNTILTITASPDWSIERTKYTKVANTGNPVYFLRNYFEVKDVDETLDNFLVYFKEKYLKSLQFVNTTETKTLIKHSLDLYRSKGTERSIELLFRLAFGITPKVYYPSTDLFRLSDGSWKIPKYLEVSINPSTHLFVDKQIVGLKSGATAFAESVIRRTVEGKFEDVIYISQIHGTFQNGEPINTSDNLLDIQDCPKITGSLNSVVISESGIGSGFEVGNVLNISSLRGRQGRARVKTTSNTSGQVTFNLDSGGYGYTSNVDIIISEKVLRISNIVYTNTSLTEMFDLYDNIYQPMAYINYVNSNGTFTATSNIYTYHANNLQKGFGTILSNEMSNSIAGTLKVAVRSGNLEGTVVFSESNGIYANVAGSNAYTDLTATGNVVGMVDIWTLTVNSATDSFTRGDYLYQVNGSNTVTAFGTVSSNLSTISGFLTVSNVHGAFNTNYPIIDANSLAQANVITSEIRVGVIVEGNNNFSSEESNYIYSPNVEITGTITDISTGSGASFSLSNSLLYSEFIDFNTDFIEPYANIALNASTYGFPGNTAANISYGVLEDILTYANTEVGKLSHITSMNMGTLYNYPPVIKIIDPFVFTFKKIGKYSLTVSNVSTSFVEGEIITQSATNARGLVISANDTVLEVERLRYSPENHFVSTVNATTIIESSLSGATANIDLVVLEDLSLHLGENALIDTEINISNGAITELEILDSGFGYLPGEELTLTYDDQSLTGYANVSTHGIASGFYLRNGGFLSHNKKLFDGYYWQNYSYEIRSSRTLDKYINMLKSVVHVAGTIPFGAFYHDTDAELSSNATMEISVS